MSRWGNSWCPNRDFGTFVFKRGKSSTDPTILLHLMILSAGIMSPKAVTKKKQSAVHDTSVDSPVAPAWETSERKGRFVGTDHLCHHACFSVCPQDHVSPLPCLETLIFYLYPLNIYEIPPIGVFEQIPLASTTTSVINASPIS